MALCFLEGEVGKRREGRGKRRGRRWGWEREKKRIAKENRQELGKEDSGDKRGAQWDKPLGEVNHLESGFHLVQGGRIQSIDPGLQQLQGFLHTHTDTHTQLER